MASKGLNINAARETARITSFIRAQVKSASANGVVIGLSGGIDSAVVGALCVRALGKGKVLGLMLPSEHTPKQDADDAHELADSWDIRIENLPISDVVGATMKASKIDGSRVAVANLQARVRMSMLYYYANSLGCLVAGTGDRSESQVGYYTKFGDGGVDFLPIAHLYKTQVRRLGTYLGVPKRIVDKPASPQLWPDQRASDELPADYDKLDLVLHQLFDLKANPSSAARAVGVPIGVVRQVLEMHKKTEHKRRLPPSLA